MYLTATQGRVLAQIARGEHTDASRLHRTYDALKARGLITYDRNAGLCGEYVATAKGDDVVIAATPLPTVRLVTPLS